MGLSLLPIGAQTPLLSEHLRPTSELLFLPLRGCMGTPPGTLLFDEPLQPGPIGLAVCPLVRGTSTVEQVTVAPMGHALRDTFCTGHILGTCLFLLEWPPSSPGSLQAAGPGAPPGFPWHSTHQVTRGSVPRALGAGQPPRLPAPQAPSSPGSQAPRSLWSGCRQESCWPTPPTPSPPALQAPRPLWSWCRRGSCWPTPQPSKPPGSQPPRLPVSQPPALRLPAPQAPRLPGLCGQGAGKGHAGEHPQPPSPPGIQSPALRLPGSQAPGLCRWGAGEGSSHEQPACLVSLGDWRGAEREREGETHPCSSRMQKRTWLQLQPACLLPGTPPLPGATRPGSVWGPFLAHSKPHSLLPHVSANTSLPQGPTNQQESS